MAQSLNKTVEFHTTGVSTLEWGERLKNPSRECRFEFYADANVEDYVKFLKSSESN